MTEYRVQFVTDYLTIETLISLDLDEYTGNASSEAHKQAVIEADASVEYEFGKRIADRANQITVTLLLDDGDELELEGE
jgi:hypothetical protein